MPVVARHGPPVRDDKAAEPEAVVFWLALEDVSEQVLVLSALGATDAVVGGHDRTHPALLYDHGKVLNIDLA